MVWYGILEFNVPLDTVITEYAEPEKACTTSAAVSTER